MTELTLLVVLEVCGLVFALGAVRSLSIGAKDGVSLRRIASAVERATLSFVTRERRLFAVLAAGAASVIGLAHLGVGQAKHAGFAVAGVVLGATLASVAAAITTLIATRAAGSTLALARIRLDDSLAAALRGGGACALLAQALGTLGGLGAFALAAWLAGAPHANVAGAPFALLPAYALGATLSALSAARACGVYHAGSDAGGDQGAHDVNLEPEDPRNPALVADVVGDQLGGVTARSAVLFASAASSTVAALWLALGVAGNATGATPLAGLPLVFRSFGVVACVAALLTTRGEEARAVGPALARGQVSAAVIALFGFVAASYWLAPSHFLVLGGLGALGMISAAFASSALGLLVSARKRALRDGAGAGGGALSSALGVGVEAAAAPLVFAALGAGVACELGAAHGLAGGRAFAFLVWFMGLSSLAPLSSGLVSFAAMTDSARGMAHLSGDGGDGLRRLHRLDDVGFVASSVARVHLALTAAGAAVAVAWALAATRSSGAAADAGPLPVLAVGAALLAAAVVFSFSANTARAAARAARDVGTEVDRQLRGFPREQGMPMIPEEYTPSYRGCEDVAARTALGSVLAAGLAALGPPVVLGIALGLVYREGGSPLATAALTTFVVTVAVTGLGAALAVDGARAVLTGARRASRPDAGSASIGASITGDALADIWSNAAGPAASSLCLFTSAVALVINRLLP